MTFLFLLIFLALIALIGVFAYLIVQRHYKSRVYRDWKQNNPTGTRRQFDSWWEDR